MLYDLDNLHLKENLRRDLALWVRYSTSIQSKLCIFYIDRFNKKYKPNPAEKRNLNKDLRQ